MQVAPPGSFYDVDHPESNIVGPAPRTLTQHPSVPRSFDFHLSEQDECGAGEGSEDGGPGFEDPGDLDFGGSNFGGSNFGGSNFGGSSSGGSNGGGLADLEVESSVIADETIVEEKVEVAAVGDTVFDFMTNVQDYGCTEEEHNEAIARHVHDGDCHDLSATYEGFEPDRSGSQDVGLFSTRVPTPMGRPRGAYRSPRCFERAFTGVGEDGAVRNICLDEEAKQVPIEQSVFDFDVDSLILFLTTLGALLTNFFWDPTRNVARNLKRSVHITVPIVTGTKANGEPRFEWVGLHRIPHLYLGSVEAWYGSSVILVSPALYYKNRDTNFYTQEQVDLLINRLLMPIFRRHLPSSTFQYYPADTTVARHNSVAHRDEHGGKKTQHPTFCVGARHLSDIWRDFQEEVRADGPLAVFRDSFLIVDSKNTKLANKETSLASVCQAFRRKLEQIVNPALVWEFTVDIGRSDIVPAVYSVFTGQDERAITLLPRRCCLERMLARIEGAVGGMRRANWYNVLGLRDGVCVTAESTPTSIAARGGLVNLQIYASLKAMGDAQATYPFDEEDLPDMAVDPSIYAASAVQSKTSAAHDLAKLVRSWQASKTRSVDNYSRSMYKEYGVRVEPRLNSAAFAALERRAIAAARASTVQQSASPRASSQRSASPRPQPQLLPSWCWPILTRNFVCAMLGNYNKIITAFETSTITAPGTGITELRSQFRTVVILYLQSLPNADFSRQPCLAISDEADGRWGVGVLRALRDTGFAWWRPSVVDWDIFTFGGHPAGTLTGVASKTLRWYRAGSRLIQDTDSILQLAFRYLPMCMGNAQLTSAVFSLVNHTLYRSFRRDMILLLKKELRDHIASDEQKDAVQFCMDGLLLAFSSEPNQVSGNTCKAKRPENIIEWYWTDSVNHKFPRSGFKDREWRGEYQKVVIAMDRAGEQLKAAWKKAFDYDFFVFHPLLPYPAGNGLTFISKTKKDPITNVSKRNYWASVQESGTIRWLAGAVQKQHPPPYPNILNLSLDEMEEELRRYV